MDGIRINKWNWSIFSNTLCGIDRYNVSRVSFRPFTELPTLAGNSIESIVAATGPVILWKMTLADV